MAISSRQAGAIVECPTCGEQTLVPEQDLFAPEPARQSPPAEASESSEPPPVPPPIPPRNTGRIPLAASAATEKGEPARSEPAENIPAESEPAEEILADDADLGDEFVPDESVPLEPVHQQLDESSAVPFIPGELESDDDSDKPLAIRRRRMAEEEMDLTPMVDVTFQLLIFFMVSASFSLQKSIEVPLPDPDQQGASQQVQILEDLLGTSIILKVDAENTIWIDDEPLGDPLRLADTLRDKMRREQKTELLVTADTQSQHRTVIAVIDAANEAGMQKIRMTSRKKAD